MSQTIVTHFRGNFAFLSNFYKTPVVYERRTFPSAEHAYQSAKTSDPKTKSQFTDHTLSSAEVKRLGGNIIMIPHWDTRKLFVMRDVLAAKFEPGTMMAALLLDTGDATLYHGNDHRDEFWGVHDLAENGRGGYGQNWLGKLLMHRRWELQESRGRLPL